MTARFTFLACLEAVTKNHEAIYCVMSDLWLHKQSNDLCNLYRKNVIL